MPKVLAVQHAAHEPLGTIASVLQERGFDLDIKRLDAGESVPTDVDGLAGLVVMGGPMGVYEADRFPFLTQELRLIEKALGRELPVLGICLGSQLLAAALGAQVFPSGRQEIGWYPLNLSQAAREDALFAGLASPLEAFHWHGDTFTLPAGAVHLASSAMTEQQAFRHGRAAYGLQFHLEVTPAVVRDFAQDESLSPTARETMLRGANVHGVALEAVGRLVFERWAALLTG